MVSLAERIAKASTNPHAHVATEDKVKIRDWIDTGNVALNCQLSSNPYKGIASGRIYQFAGPESVGKTYLTVEVINQAQLEGYTVLYYDAEGTQTKDSLRKRGLETDNVVLSPISTVKALQTDFLNMLDEVSKSDKLIVCIDSIGMLASLKEVADAKAGNDKADMTAAKELRSFFRTITVPCQMAQVPVLAVNHTYENIMNMYGGPIVAKGGGSKYAASVTLILSKAQVKDKDGNIVGALITSKADKNRMAREKSKIKFEINYHKGLNRWSGLFDICLEYGYILSPKQGWYHVEGNEDHKFRRKDTELNEEFWLELMENGLADQLKLYFAYQAHTDGVIDEDGFDDEVVDLDKE
jgi:RecA/RadA recombinase